MDYGKFIFTLLIPLKKGQLIQFIRIDSNRLFIVFGTSRMVSAILLLFCCVFSASNIRDPPRAGVDPLTGSSCVLLS